MPDKSENKPKITVEERRRIEEISSHSKATSTRSRYDRDVVKFLSWLEDRGEDAALPISPGLVLVYLSECADKYKMKTIRLIISAIKDAHETAGHASPTDDPEVKELIEGLARGKRGEGLKQAPALSRDGLEKIIRTACIPRPRGRGQGKEMEQTARKRGREDIAMLHVQFDGMLRIGELCDLLWGDIGYNPDRSSGTATIRYSKTDQGGEGAIVWLSPGAMSALEAIRPVSEQPDDRIFRISMSTVERRIKAAGIAAGLGDGLSGHSARVGMTQELVKAGIHIAAIMRAGRWSSSEMVPYYSRNILASESGVAQYYRGASDVPQEAVLYRPAVSVRAPV